MVIMSSAELTEPYLGGTSRSIVVCGGYQILLQLV